MKIKEINTTCVNEIYKHKRLVFFFCKKFLVIFTFTYIICHFLHMCGKLFIETIIKNKKVLQLFFKTIENLGMLV